MRRAPLPRFLVIRSDRLCGAILAGHDLDFLLRGGPRDGQGSSRAPLVLEDAADLLVERTEPDAVLLADADGLSVGDAGLLRRWREDGDRRRLVLVGSEAGARRLAEAGARADEVLDWSELAPAAPQAHATSCHQDEELSTIEAILRSEPIMEPTDEASTNGNGSHDRRERGQASRVARRFPSRPGSQPRTAFLRSTIRPGGAAAGEARATAPGAAPAADPLDSSEPLLTPEELDAFFSPLEEPRTEPTAPTEIELDQEVEDALEAATAELDAIAELLEGEAEPAWNTDREPLAPGTPETPEDGLDHVQLAEPADTARIPDADAPEERTSARATGAARPAWLKQQIADLADMVQALELRARTNNAQFGMEAELARLRQFCRTLGLVASPPAHRRQDFDLAVHVEEQLGQLAGASPDAPRLLFRAKGENPTVAADKTLVACAVDAVLQTAVACGGSGDVVRVQVIADGRAVTLDVEFPPGPLIGRAPDEIMEPYAVRDVLPEIGANALAAAGAIAVGQGGDLLFGEREGGAVGFTLQLLRAPVRA